MLMLVTLHGSIAIEYCSYMPFLNLNNIRLLLLSNIDSKIKSRGFKVKRVCQAFARVFDTATARWLHPRQTVYTLFSHFLLHPFTSRCRWWIEIVFPSRIREFDNDAERLRRWPAILYTQKRASIIQKPSAQRLEYRKHSTLVCSHTLLMHGSAATPTCPP